MDQDFREQLEKDRQRFEAWRASRQGKEMIPEELWEVAVSYIPHLNLNQVSRKFRLSHTQLKRKAIELGMTLPEHPRQKNSPSKKFVPLVLPEIWSNEISLGNCPRLVLERADGRRLRIEGILPELRYLEAVAGYFFRG